MYVVKMFHIDKRMSQLVAWIRTFGRSASSCRLGRLDTNDLLRLYVLYHHGNSSRGGRLRESL